MSPHRPHFLPALILLFNLLALPCSAMGAQSSVGTLIEDAALENDTQNKNEKTNSANDLSKKAKEKNTQLLEDANTNLQREKDFEKEKAELEKREAEDEQKIKTAQSTIDLANSMLTDAETYLDKINIKNSDLQGYAAKNQKLAKELSNLARDTIDKYELRDRVAEQNLILGREYNAVKTKIELMGLSQQIGEVISDQRSLLPDLRLFHTEQQNIYGELTQITLRRLEIQNDLGWRFEPSKEKSNLVKGLNSSKISSQQSQAIDQLITQRKQILTQLNDTSETYLRLLSEIDQQLVALIETVSQYQDYLNSNLIWIRVPYRFFNKDGNIVENEIDNIQLVAHLFESANYLTSNNMPTLIWDGLIFIFAICAGFFSRKKYHQLRKSLHFNSTNFSNLAQYLLMVLLRLVTPVLAAYFAVYHLHYALFPHSTELLISRLWVYVLLSGLIYYLAKPNGFLQEFLAWPSELVNTTYRCAKNLYWVASPVLLIAFVPVNALANQSGGIIGSMLLIFCIGLFAYYTHLFLKQPYAILASVRVNKLVTPAPKTQQLFDKTILAINCFWILAFLVGYRYASAKISAAVFESMLVLLYTIIVYQSVLTWLNRVQIRQKYILRQEEGKTTQGVNTNEGVATLETERIDAMDKNIEALGEDSRKLILLTLWSIGLVILYTIWAPLLPASAILDKITLWSYMSSSGDGAVEQAVTLKIFIVAVVTTVILLIASRRLPPFIEIVVRNRLSLENGTMYTVKMLLSYVLIAIAIIHASNALGFSWSKIQWAVAALSVGIGFGLQEIVANFISGLIILFEKPIRVGDLVTINNQTGVVRKIQIRATTIVDFDNKELLVPNKEFITSALLNWTLSDRELRVMISVGISYQSNVDLALELLEKIAKEHPLVLDDPAPVVTFESFGDSTLNLFLRCRIGSIDDRLQVITELHKIITQRYREEDIEIAFPQRDLHIDSLKPLEVVLKKQQDK